MIPYIAGAERRRIEKALVRRVRLFEDETESRVFGKRARLCLKSRDREGNSLRMHRNEGTAKLSHKINLEGKTLV